MKSNLILVLLCLSISGMLFAQSDIEIVKQRVIDEILNQSVNDTEISELILKVKKDGSWTGIDYKDLSRTGFEHRYHLVYLEKLSFAYQKNSSSYYHKRKLLKLVNLTLKYWCDHDFISGNWYHNQVSTPRQLVAVLLLMDDQIDEGLKNDALKIIARAHLNASGARPGGDRIKFGGTDAKRRLVIGDEESFSEIMKVINNEVKFNTGGRGMQHDYSFHHRYDRVNTTYSYGTNYANVFAEWAAYVAGTEYAFSLDKIEQLIDYYLDGICKQAVYGIYHEKGAMNRGISRKESFSPISTVTPERLLLTSSYRKDELEEIIALRKGEHKPTASFAKFFWQSEHFVLQRPDFFTSVRMFSIRNQSMEHSHNSEGIFNHHRGDGTNHLSIKGDEYLNIWPVYDWQKIPGTTILQKPELPGEKELKKNGVTDFVGALTDGYYGAVAFDFISPHDFTRARKGWFFFDDEYVCLGAGIESPSRTLALVTTLEQNLLQGDVVTSDGSNTNILSMGLHKIENVKWVLHNGTGFIFPDSTRIHLSNKEQSGRWSDINKQSTSPKELVTKDVFALWFDHGVRPQGNLGETSYASTIPDDVKYQYMVVPRTTQEQLNENRGIEVLVNNRTMQAVYDHQSGIVQSIFYHAGEINISEEMKLVIDSPGVVMLKLEKGKVEEITVADPSRSLGRIHLHISGLTDISIELPTGVFAGQSVQVDM